MILKDNKNAMVSNILKANLQFFCEKESNKGGQTWEEGCKKHTDVSDVNSHVEEIHGMIDHGRCDHETCEEEMTSLESYPFFFNQLATFLFQLNTFITYW